MQRVVQEEERKVESAWFRNVNPSTCNVDIVLTKLMENRYTVIVGIFLGQLSLASISLNYILDHIKGILL